MYVIMLFIEPIFHQKSRYEKAFPSIFSKKDVFHAYFSSLIFFIWTKSHIFATGFNSLAMTQDVSPSAFIARNTVSGVTPSFQRCSQVFGKASSRYRNIQLHIGCKKQGEHLCRCLMRRVCPRRPPRSSRPGYRGLTHRGVHRECPFR